MGKHKSRAACCVVIGSDSAATAKWRRRRPGRHQIQIARVALGFFLLSLSFAVKNLVKIKQQNSLNLCSLFRLLHSTVWWDCPTSPRENTVKKRVPRGRDYTNNELARHLIPLSSGAASGNQVGRVLHLFWLPGEGCFDAKGVVF